MAHLTAGRNQVLIFFECAVYTIRGKITVGILQPFARRVLDSILRSFARYFDTGLTIVRVAPLRQLLGTSRQQLSSTPRHRFGKA